MQGMAEPIPAARAEQTEPKYYEEEYSCCDGRLYNVAEKKRAILTLVLIQALVTLHEVLHISWFSTQHSFALIALIIALQFLNFYTFLFITTRQPGIIQKINEKYQIQDEFIVIPKNQHIKSHIQISYIVPDCLKVNRIKFCLTCNIYRPPRSSHCDVCGVCIQRMDHHCPWLGTCIGKSNYKYFYLFLLSLSVLIALVFAMCVMIMNSSGPLSDTLRRFPFSIILSIICVPAFVFAMIMLVFHTHLILRNLTTKEYFDSKWQIISGNLYDKENCCKNIFKIFFNMHQRQIKYRYVPQQSAQNNEASSSSEGKISHSQSKKKSNSSEEEKRQKALKMEAIEGAEIILQTGDNNNANKPMQMNTMSQLKQDQPQ